MEFEKIRAIIADVLNKDVEEISKESRFTEDLGCDSIDVMSIVFAVEKQFNVKIQDDMLQNIVTVGDVEEQLKKL